MARGSARDTLAKMEHSVARELDEAMPLLDAATQAQLETLIRDALALATGKRARGAATDEHGYPLGHFERTYGSFADEPLERPSQGELEVREGW